MRQAVIENRKAFARGLQDQSLTVAPLCLNPLMARIAQGSGFTCGYLSGGALGFELAISEALLSISEVSSYARQITSRSSISLIVDVGVGFGDAVHAWRTCRDIEATGAVALEIEDQVSPKRVHHHKGVEHLVSQSEMEEKIRETVGARDDPNFTVIARTSAIANESVGSAIERAEAYTEAGADVILLSPRSEEEIKILGRSISVPMALITASGKWNPDLLLENNFRLVLDPFSAQVAAIQAIQTTFTQAYNGNGASNMDALMEIYKTLQLHAGLQELYEIEERTTERYEAHDE
ncbi:MAG: isocitrate lyase/phosphoenolpyruvate mutase family protein [Chloroflexota bacterium]|nr:isocitrate lyase/phosphoenolpyruvate mutase family protein [Chloroflexota bacterium]